MDAIDAFRHVELSNVHHTIIPTDNFLRLIELLLLIAPLDLQQSISTLDSELSSGTITDITRTAKRVLSCFIVEHDPGVTYITFNTAITAYLPLLFNGLNLLFEHFLFAKDLDLSKRKSNSASLSTETQPVVPPPKAIADAEPVLREPGEILDSSTLSQLSFFIPGSELFHRIRPLYNGNTHGFSMGSFEKQVFNWRAPTVLLVQGRLLPSASSNTRERAFQDSLSHDKLSNSLAERSSDETLIYGAYILSRWKHTGKTCFGNSSTILFQLGPTHDVFSASTFGNDFVYFNKSPTTPAGVGLGTSVPTQSASHSSSQRRFRPGPVSLHLDDALEFGVFTHLAAGGGSFYPSKLPCRRGKDWQDRFEIENLEVWGCGGDEVAEMQRKEFAWQEREAEARRRVNLGTGDKEMDRELMKMAGIISNDRSGGSMG